MKRPGRSLRSTHSAALSGATTTPDVTPARAGSLYKRVLVLSLVFVIVGAVCVKRIADWIVLDEPKITQGFDPLTWKRCPGKKPVKFKKQTYYWYCGPENAAPVFAEAL